MAEDDAIKGLALRYFEPSSRGGKSGKRKEHVMVAGGREGMTGSTIPPRDPKYWSGGPQRRWTKELEANSTYPDAKTQPPLLREVRPEQRLYSKGYMKVSDMLDILDRGLFGRNRPLGVELTLLTEDGTLQAIPVQVRQGPVFTGLLGKSEEARERAAKSAGAPVEWKQGQPIDNLKKVLEAAENLYELGLPIEVRIRGQQKPTRGEDVRLEGRKLSWLPERGLIAIKEEKQTAELKNIASVRLLGAESGETEFPYYARLVGIPAIIEGVEQAVPLFLIARLRLIRDPKDDRPVPKASLFMGDVKATEDVRAKAQAHLDRLADEAWRLRSFRRHARGAARREGDPWAMNFADPVSQLVMRVTPDKKLIWSDVVGSSKKFSPVALLREYYPGNDDIVVNVDDYLRLSRLTSVMPPEEKPEVKSNPLGASMRHNPIVYYRSQAELDALKVTLGAKRFAKMMEEGAILPAGARSQRSQPSGVGYIPAGRRAAQAGVGMRITRANPFQKVTEPGPGKIKVTSKRGKILYMTRNQISAMGDKMLAPGEAQRALALANPARPRGAMSGAQRAAADKKRSRRHMDANLDRAFRRQDDEDDRKLFAQEDEDADFAKYMAQLGLKANRGKR